MPIKPQEPRLLHAPPKVSACGHVIDWTPGEAVRLTPAEISELNRRKCNLQKAEQIKGLMRFKTCAQIVRHFAGVDGYGERTVKGIHAALSAVGERG